jgi:hypothetical protein
MEDIKNRNLGSQLDKVVNRPIDSENIDTYAEEALRSVATIIEDAKVLYDTLGLSDSEGKISSRVEEDSVLRTFRLPQVPEVLDSIIQVAEEIEEVGEVADRVASSQANKPMLVPSSGESLIVKGSGVGIEERRRVSKLKTSLYVLKRVFGVDLENEDEIRFVPGGIPEGSMRRHGYILVDVAKLNKALLICDEVGNVTYLLNKEMLPEGMTIEDLALKEKDDIDKIIEEQPLLGARLTYNPRGYASAIAEFLKTGKLEVGSQGGYIRPLVDRRGRVVEKAGEDDRSAKSLADELGVGHKLIHKIIAELISSGVIDELPVKRFGSVDTLALSPKMQELVRGHPRIIRVMSARPARPGEHSVGSFAVSIGLSNHFVGKALGRLRDAGIVASDLPYAKFGTKVAIVLPESVQAEILNEPEVRKLLEKRTS